MLLTRTHTSSDPGLGEGSDGSFTLGLDAVNDSLDVIVGGDDGLQSWGDRVPQVRVVHDGAEGVQQVVVGGGDVGTGDMDSAIGPSLVELAVVLFHQVTELLLELLSLALLKNDGEELGLLVVLQRLKVPVVLVALLRGGRIDAVLLGEHLQDGVALVVLDAIAVDVAGQRVTWGFVGASGLGGVPLFVAQSDVFKMNTRVGEEEADGLSAAHEVEVYELWHFDSEFKIFLFLTNQIIQLEFYHCCFV